MNTTDIYAPAEAFPVGEYLRDELEARGWSVGEFASILGRPVQAVSEILNGRKQVTATTAVEIAAATGTNAQTWLSLQDTYSLWLATQEGNQEQLHNVGRRARLASLVPLAELRKRRVLPASLDLDDTEAAVSRFLGVSSLDEPPRFAIAARRSDEGSPISPAQTAWIACAHHAAASLKVNAFDQSGLAKTAAGLAARITKPEALQDVPSLLAKNGVKLVHIPNFKGSKIDGAAWIDERGGPNIAISARIGRLDSVLFTLLHEVAHIVLGHAHDGITIDSDIDLQLVNGKEQEANQLASTWLLPELPEIQAPYSSSKITSAANRLGIHPSILVGQLQHAGHLPWSHLRALTPNSRPFLEAWPSYPRPNGEGSAQEMSG